MRHFLEVGHLKRWLISRFLIKEAYIKAFILNLIFILSLSFFSHNTFATGVLAETQSQLQNSSELDTLINLFSIEFLRINLLSSKVQSNLDSYNQLKFFDFSKKNKISRKSCSDIDQHINEAIEHLMSVNVGKLALIALEKKESDLLMTEYARYAAWLLQSRKICDNVSALPHFIKYALFNMNNVLRILNKEPNLLPSQSAPKGDLFLYD